MGLAPVEPPQEVIDALVLEAAWERASQLETEVRNLKAVCEANHKAFETMARRRQKLAHGIAALATAIRGNQDMSLDSIVASLRRLVENDQ